MKAPVHGSQSLIWPVSCGFFQSPEPAERIAPSGENAGATARACSPPSVARTDAVAVSLSRTSPPSQPMARVLPSGA